MNRMHNHSIKPPTWYWVVAVIAILWNLMGVSAYIQQITMSAATLDALPEAERLLYENFPIWANAAFAIAVFAGFLGCVALLLRKKIALPLFWLSLMGVLIQSIYNVFLSGAMELYGPASLVMPLVILLFALFLIWMTKKAIAQSWLN